MTRSRAARFPHSAQGRRPQAQAQTTAASVEVARNQAKAAVAQAELSRKSELVAEARVKQSQAQLAQAELNLSYTAVAAPMTGRVTQRTVESGNYVQTGQALLALVPEQVWVVANFKESQLKNMRPGQPATIEVDAISGPDIRRRVDSDPKRICRRAVQIVAAGDTD